MRSRNAAVLGVVMVVSCLCFGLPRANAVIDFNDGGIYDIDYEIDDDVRVDWEAPGMETTVNLLAGGSIGRDLCAYGSSQVSVSGGLIEDDLETWGSSHVSVFGGEIGDDLKAYGSSQVSVSGGSIVYGSLFARDTSQVTFSGGEIGVSLVTWDSSEVTFSDGLIGGQLSACDNSQVTFSGGSIGNDLIAFDSSQVTISGGSIGEDIISGYYADDEGVISFVGSDFAIDGQAFGYGELTSLFGGNWGVEPPRQLTGTLLSGDPLDNYFYIGYDAKIVLVPEPGTVLLLGLGAVMLRKRRS